MKKRNRRQAISDKEWVTQRAIKKKNKSDIKLKKRNLEIKKELRRRQRDGRAYSM